MDKKKEGQKPPREIPKLSHVDTKKQEVDQTAIADALSFQKTHDIQQKAELESNGLSSEDQNLLASFEKKRMLLDRIWIIVNQTRAQIQLEPLKRDEIKQKLLRLVELGYLTYEEIPYEKSVNEVFILTDKGEELIE